MRYIETAEPEILFNAVSVLKIDPGNGTLQVVQNQKISGLWPRGCALSPNGRFLLVCCRDSQEVLVYPVREDGCLGETIHTVENPHAAYAVFCVERAAEGVFRAWMYSQRSGEPGMGSVCHT